jgi:tetratricopeptide (TPR) repeat protein
MNKAFIVNKKIGDKRIEGSILNNLGNEYWALGEVLKAIEYYKQALEIALEIGDKSGIGNALTNLGIAHEAFEEREKAKTLWLGALVIYRAIEHPDVAKLEKLLADLDKER